MPSAEKPRKKRSENDSYCGQEEFVNEFFIRTAHEAIDALKKNPIHWWFFPNFMFFRHALFAGDRVIPPSMPLSSFHPANVLRNPVAAALLCLCGLLC